MVGWCGPLLDYNLCTVQNTQCVTQTQLHSHPSIRIKGHDHENLAPFTRLYCRPAIEIAISRDALPRLLHDTVVRIRIREYCMIYRGLDFSPSWDLAPPPPLPPVVSSTGDTQEVWNGQLADGFFWEEGGWGRSQIIGRRESLVLFNSYNTRGSDPIIVKSLLAEYFIVKFIWHLYILVSEFSLREAVNQAICFSSSS